MYQIINDFHTEQHLGLDHMSGGQIRKLRGNLVEEIASMIWKESGKNRTALHQQKHSYEVNGLKAKVGCDVDCFENGVLKCIIECKAYADKCYIDRAATDFRYLHNLAKVKVPKIVVSLEDSVAANALAIIKYLNRDISFNKVFFLCDGKRNSDRPLYIREYFKPINENKLMNLVTYLRSL